MSLSLLSMSRCLCVSLHRKDQISEDGEATDLHILQDVDATSISRQPRKRAISDQQEVGQESVSQEPREESPTELLTPLPAGMAACGWTSVHSEQR